MFTASAACRTARLAGEMLNTETRRHIRLENLPRTTLPADIERALRRERLVGVENVQLQLFRFLPTCRAYITLSHPDFLRMNTAKLGKVTIGGHTVTAIPCLEPPKIENLRGVKGRKAALERGSLPGLASSGAMSNGRQVCAWGFPPKASAESVKDFLKYNKVDTLGDKPEIYKVNLVRKTSRRILSLLEIPDSDPVHIRFISYSPAHPPDTLPARQIWYKIPGASLRSSMTACTTGYP